MARRSHVFARRDRGARGDAHHDARRGADRARRARVGGRRERRARVPLLRRGPDAGGGQGRRGLAGVPVEAFRRALRRPRVRRRGGPRIRGRRERLHLARSPDRRDLDRSRAVRAARAPLLRVLVGVRPRTGQAVEGDAPDLSAGVRPGDRGARPVRAFRLRARPGRPARGRAAARGDGPGRADAGARPSRARQSPVACAVALRWAPLAAVRRGAAAEPVGHRDRAHPRPRGNP